MPELKALLFDVDGTLANTEKNGHRIAFNMAFKKAGLDWFWDEELYGKLLEITGGKERINHYLEFFNTSFNKPNNLDAFIKDLHSSKTLFYTQILSQGSIPLRTGVERLIKEARSSNMRMAIVTTTTPVNVDALLKNTLGNKSLDWFEVIAAGDIVTNKKPAPDIYELAMEQMNILPEEALAFEDSINGLKSSTAAGLKTIIIPNSYTKNDDFSNASIVLDKLGEPDEAFKVLSGNAPKHQKHVNIDWLKTFFHKTSLKEHL